VPTKAKDHIQHQHNPSVVKEPGEVQFTSQELRDEKDKKPAEVRQRATDGKAPYPSKEDDEDVKAATVSGCGMDALRSVCVLDRIYSFEV
jgi:hypothetical protein